MRIFRAAAVIALLAGPVYAQQAHVPRYGEINEPKTDQEIRSEKADDTAYKKSLGNIPDKGPTDPWGNVRNDGPPKTAAKNTKMHPKTGTAAK